MDPTDDLIQHIKSGKMLEDIEYTWWEMLLKYNKIEGIFVHDGADLSFTTQSEI